jgi:endonuclease/exonuclease/phosphatase family metal-dependent hydrolase
MKLVAGGVDLLGQRRVRSASSRKATATTIGGVTSPTPARETGGWRIDYFLVFAALQNSVKSAAIDVLGSDHCPVNVEIAA